MLSFSKQINTTDERKTFFIENLTGDCLVVKMGLFCCFVRAELNMSLLRDGLLVSAITVQFYFYYCHHCSNYLQ